MLGQYDWDHVCLPLVVEIVRLEKQIHKRKY